MLKQALFPFVTESQSSVGDLSEEDRSWTRDLLKTQENFPEQISNDRYTTLLLKRERAVKRVLNTRKK